jgi:hypothetical protein
LPPAAKAEAHVAVVTFELVTTATDAHKTTGAPPFKVELKATWPVGLVVPATLGVMVAVKVTDWFTAADGTEETTVAVVGVKPTTCESTPETLPVKFESPLVYVATTLLVPAETKVKLQTGTTPATSALLHNTVAVDVSVKTTVPVGLAVPVNPGVTTAVKATD